MSMLSSDLSSISLNKSTSCKFASKVCQAILFQGMKIKENNVEVSSDFNKIDKVRNRIF